MAANITDVLSLDLPAFIIGIGFHEFCHAFAADRLGDPTPREQGRVSLNPIDHLDPLGTVLPLILSMNGSPVVLGWGKPVVVNPEKFRNPTTGFGVVAIAGPLGNLLICCLIGLLLRNTTEVPALLQAITTPGGNFFYRLLFRIFAMNLGLFLFNLVPIPPLDGAKVLSWLGGDKIKSLMDKAQEHSLVIFLLFIMSGLDMIILAPLFIKASFFLAGDQMAYYMFKPAQFIADFL